MISLAIETSCDDTSLAILKDYVVVEMITHSQSHQGGVIPEKASRLHTEVIFDLIESLCKKTKIKLKSLKAIFVTKGPGLVNTLQVGLIVAKTISQILKIPLYGINHLNAHAFSAFVGQKFSSIPTSKTLFVIISGGHTLIGKYKNSKYDLKELISTSDDAIGEAYDKVGRILGLSYPSGKVIDELFFSYKNDEYYLLTSKNSSKQQIKLSYSGLKTKIKMLIAKEKNLSKNNITKIAASFQFFVIKDLVSKILVFAKQQKVENIVFGGGVSANKFLRELLKDDNFKKYKIYFPEFKYTTDNAGMIGYYGNFLLKNNTLKQLSLKSDSFPKLKFGGL